MILLTKNLEKINASEFVTRLSEINNKQTN